jgi:ectoine hydroxylase-related dioxygenase (phytanoyl-CoA dioxygenase family)
MNSHPTTLPPMETPFPLTPGQIAAYRRDGHILLRGVASPEEIKAYRGRLRTVVEEFAAKRDRQGRTEDYSRLFVQVTNVWRRDEALRQIIFSPRFARIAAELMGVAGVRLYHDQALFKPASGKPTPWHQDQFYWPLETPNTVTLWMPLIDLAEEMGTMIFAGGSHLDGPLLQESISTEAGAMYARLVRERGFPVSGTAMNAGDATFHAGWTVHAAHRNASGQTREVLTVIYFEDGVRIAEPDSEFRKTDMQVFFPGQKPGEVAGTPINPLLYSSPTSPPLP